MNESGSQKLKWSTRKKVLVTVAAGTGAVLAFFYGSLLVQVGLAYSAFDLFRDALISKNYPRAYSLTSSDFRSATSQAEFTQQQEALCAHLGPLKSVKVGPFEVEGNPNQWSATTNSRFVFERAERQFLFSMTKEGGSWRVYGYKELE